MNLHIIVIYIKLYINKIINRVIYINYTIIKYNSNIFYINLYLK